MVVRPQFVGYHTDKTEFKVNHGSNYARRCLTSVIGRETVFSTRYGRRHTLTPIKVYVLNN